MPFKFFKRSKRAKASKVDDNDDQNEAATSSTGMYDMPPHLFFFFENSQSEYIFCMITCIV